MTTEELNVIITAQNKEFNKRLDEVNGQLDTLGKKAESSARSTSGAFRSMAAVLSSLGIAKLLGDLNNAYTVQMMNETKLETVMRNRIGATEEEIASVKRLTAAQQQIGIIGDEIQLAGAQQLATFATSTETIKTLIPAMNNLMAQQNGFNSTESSAVSVAGIIGKALQGQTSALTRAKLSFSEAQEQVLKYGTEAQRAATIVEIITQNVGDMNAALRATSTGQLKATLNDFGDLKEEIGATFQPLIVTILPMVGAGLQAIRPYVKKLGEGFETLADYISALSPETKKLITQGVMSVPVIMAVTKGMRLLSLATRSASGWLGVIVTVLSLLTAYRKIKEFSENSANAFDEEEESANNAAAGVGNLNDSVGELGETTKKSLAAVDKLNIIGGSGNIISVDTEGISTAAEDISSIKDDIDEFTEQDYGIDMGVDLSWEGALESFHGLWDWLKNDGLPGLGETVKIGWDYIKNLFDFDSDTQLEEWRKLNEGVKKEIARLFDEETAEKWDKRWQEAGSLIYKGLNGTPQEKAETLEGWRVWLGDLNQEFQKFFDGIDSYFGTDSKFGDFWANWSDTWQAVGSWKADVELGTSDRMRELGLEFATLSSDMNDAIVEYLKQGKSAEEALNAAKKELLTTPEAAWYYTYGGIAKDLGDIEQWRQNLIESGQIYQYADYSDLVPAYKPDYSGRERQSISSLRSMDNIESRSRNYNITVISELDGEKIGEFSRKYSERELARSNGY